jgi:hypothetical protein
VHDPELQVRPLAVQSLPQVPQFVLLVCRLVSQPLDAIPSQSPWWPLQLKVQAPDVQTDVAPDAVGHTLPQ